MKRVFATTLTISLLMLISVVALPNNGSTSNNGNAKIKWLTFDEAVKQNKSQPKKIFVDLYTDWCTWCIKMEKATFEHPDIIEYINENFYPVKLDAETRRNISFQNNQYIYRPDAGKRGVHELAIFLTRGKLNYPSVVFLDENLNNPQPVSGFQNPVAMDKLLKFFGEDYYKNLDWGIFKQIYESPLEGRKAVPEHDAYDIQPITTEKANTPAPKANTTVPAKKVETTKTETTQQKSTTSTTNANAKVEPTSVEKVAPASVEKKAEKSTQKVEKTEKTKKANNKNNRRNRKNKK
ncbi:MAG: thioredoxin family protein [Chitinophagales bacterium]